MGLNGPASACRVLGLTPCLHLAEKRRSRAHLFLPVLDRPSTLQMQNVTVLLRRTDLQLNSLTFFLTALTLAKHKRGHLLTSLPLSGSSASTDGGQPGVQLSRGICQAGFSSFCVSVACVVGLSCALTQTGSWGGGACQTLRRRACWQRVRRQGLPASPMSLPFTPHAALLPPAFPFQAVCDVSSHRFAIG